MNKPLLSICIPTFNRAELLRGALQSICEQLKYLEEKVELIISDNCSQDNTEEVVNYFSKETLIRYYKNESNIGACKNILKLSQEYALGEFTWIIGDDDLICHDAIQSLCNILENNSNYDYFFLNHAYENSSSRSLYINPENYKVRPNHKWLLCHDTKNKILDKWECVIALSNTVGIYTSIVSHVFRTKFWQNSIININEQLPFETFESTFPHTSIAFKNFSGKPIFYVGDPLIIFFVGHQEWFSENWSKIVFTHLLNFTDELEKHRVDIHLVDKYRVTIFNQTEINLAQLINNFNNIDSDLFYLYFTKYWRYGSAWKLALRTLLILLIKQVKKYYSI